MTTNPATAPTAPPSGPRSGAPVSTRGHRGHRGRRVLWLGLALFWAAFAVLEGVHHGAGAWAAVVVGLVAPDLTMLVGAREPDGREQGRLAPRAVPYYNAAHRSAVPLLLGVVYVLVPWHPPALFAGLCGWLAHIALDRTFGYGLRGRDGRRRG